MSEALWKPARAAQEMGVSVKTLMEHVKAGDLVYIPLGFGKKRPRLAFMPGDIHAFLESRRRRETCQSTSRKTPRSTISTSKLQGGGFMALRERLRAEKQKK